MGSVHSSELLNLSENLICIQLKREMFSILAKINDWFQTNLVEYLRPRKIVNLCSVFSLLQNDVAPICGSCKVLSSASQSRAEIGHFWANNDVYRH